MFRMFLAILVAAAGASWALPSRADGRLSEIVERLENANRWRDHVMVVAHRGGWKEDGVVRWPENSRAGVEHVIALGVEMVELDVRASADGSYVVMHDSWLDRTTDCRGEVDRHTLAELKACRLVVEGSGEATDETVPTLEDMLDLTRGRVLVNVDNKLGPDHIAPIARIVAALGMQRQVFVKENVWSLDRLAAIRAALAPAAGGIGFLPILADDTVDDARFAETVTSALNADVVEMVAWRGDETGLDADAGPLFRARMRAAAARGDWHLWVNTYPIVNKPSGLLARGRGDELAVAADRPEDVYGYWAEQGATIIQTDEPAAAILWLEANGYRVPYGLTN